MRLVIVIVLSVIILLLSAQIYSFFGKERKAQQDFSDFKARLDAAKLDQEKFRAELDYYSNPVNLEKELRARFNYRSPDEKLLILVPLAASSSASSTGNN